MNKPAIEGGKPVREKKIYYGHQYLDDSDYEAVVEVLKSDYLTCGPKINELENKLCKLTGAKYAVVCSNGTAALHMAAMAAGLKEKEDLKIFQRRYQLSQLIFHLHRCILAKKHLMSL